MQATPASATSRVLSRDEARALTTRVLSFSTADQTRVTVTSERSGNTRFADGSITTSGGTHDTSVTVTVTFGRRRASSSTNVLD
jgi:predicted Zn-dependent protease